MVTKKQLADKWYELYDERFPSNYAGVWRKLPNSFSVSYLAKLWYESYGEAFSSNYSGVYRSLKLKENIKRKGGNK